jgi:hypothetical protein
MRSHMTCSYESVPFLVVVKITIYQHLTQEVLWVYIYRWLSLEWSIITKL